MALILLVGSQLVGYVLGLAVGSFEHQQDQVAFYGNYAEFAQAQDNVENTTTPIHIFSTKDFGDSPYRKKKLVLDMHLSVNKQGLKTKASASF